jgi:hypothetical protein
MVRDVFDEKAISKLIGGMGVGHGKPSGVNQSSLQSSDIVRRSSLSNCWKLKSR